ncbi:MAG: lamin tail domain-containing protein, partial [Chloroflexi bacterium]|nr:lamin tail domain-containing protein [Chloroflexota bacterium]
TILIDAVYYDGFETSEPDEAVRLRNVSGTAVDIGSWRLNDAIDASYATLTSSLTLAPNQTIWLAKEAIAFKRQFGFWPDYETGETEISVPEMDGTWPGFSNTGDEVVLMDDVGTVIDLLVYEGGYTGLTDWSGTAVQQNPVFGAEGQILYRLRDQTTGLPVADSDTAADWAQSTGDVINGRKVLYPGWDLDNYFQTTKLTESGTLTIA